MHDYYAWTFGSFGEARTHVQRAREIVSGANAAAAGGAAGFGSCSCSGVQWPALLLLLLLLGREPAISES